MWRKRLEEEGPALQMKEGNRRKDRGGQNVQTPGAYAQGGVGLVQAQVGQGLGMEMRNRSQKLHSGIPGDRSQSPGALNSGCTLEAPWKL